MALSSPANLAAIWHSDAAAHARRPPPADRAATPADLADLADLAARIRPTTGAHERTLPVPAPFDAVLPVLTRGAVVAIDGPPGAGATSLAFGLAAAVTHANEWVAAVDGEATFGAEAAQECGVDLRRFVVARRIPTHRWSAVVAALLDGVTCVIADVPPHVRVGDARRLVAKARERAAALVVVGAWPGDAAWRIRAESARWPEFGPDAGFVSGTRMVTAHVEGRGMAQRQRVVPLAG